MSTTDAESNANVLEALTSLNNSIVEQFRTVNTNMERLAERVATMEEKTGMDPTPTESTPARSTPAPSPHNRVEWGEGSMDEEYEPPSWAEMNPGEEDLPGSDELRVVSAATKRLLEDSFTKSVPNEQRKLWRKRFAAPDVDSARCPKLDKAVLAQLPKAAKDQDRNLSRLQTFVTDSIGPMVHLLEEAQQGTLKQKDVIDAIKQAVRSVGNATAQISQERRKRIASHLNSDVQDLVTDEEQFKSAPPLLFGKDFDKAVKEHVDTVKSLRKTTRPHQPSSSSGRVFRGGRPYQPGRGGGRYYQSGNQRATRGRYQPYDRGFHQKQPPKYSNRSQAQT